MQGGARTRGLRASAAEARTLVRAHSKTLLPETVSALRYVAAILPLVDARLVDEHERRAVLGLAAGAVGDAIEACDAEDDPVGAFTRRLEACAEDIAAMRAELRSPSR